MIFIYKVRKKSLFYYNIYIIENTKRLIYNFNNLLIKLNKK